MSGTEKRVYTGLIRTTDATHAAVKKIAAKNRWTLSQTLEVIVQAYLKRNREAE